LVGCTGQSAPAAGGDAGSEAGGDASLPCFLCGDAGGIFDNPDASLGERVREHLVGCNGTEDCHAGNAAGLYFPAGRETDALVNVRSTERPELFRVKPYDPINSYAYLKVLGDGGIEGGRMPLNGPYDERLPPLMLAWIEAGAPPP
jgi:hypothetical protein